MPWLTTLEEEIVAISAFAAKRKKLSCLPSVRVEKSADIYLSRVSNFLYLTPFAYLRAPAGSLPHDTGDNAI
ncbi:MAG: hypothetical protein KAI47_27385 [Deltaproteobacteria bacterium]|nr:hypothetical protein [Deltaproteobacteria bacterium]